MTVGELIAELDAYGDHLPVRLSLPPTGLAGTLQRRDVDVLLPLAVTETTVDGAIAVAIEPDDV